MYDAKVFDLGKKLQESRMDIEISGNTPLIIIPCDDGRNGILLPAIGGRLRYQFDFNGTDNGDVTIKRINDGGVYVKTRQGKLAVFQTPNDFLGAIANDDLFEIKKKSAMVKYPQ